MAPFYKFGFFGEQTSFVIAMLIGVSFGFWLERAGFGYSRKLALQFYFRDMTVLKVMFTSIVVAMVGLLYLSLFGWIDISKVYIAVYIRFSLAKKVKIWAVYYKHFFHFASPYQVFYQPYILSPRGRGRKSL